MTGLQLGIKELTPYKAGTRIQQEIGFDLAACAYRIIQLTGNIKVNIVEIGIELIRAKNNLDHGDWEDWVHNNLDFGPLTAWRYMNAARECNGNLSLAKDINLEDFWGHSPKAPNRHSPEGEPRSLQDIERALAFAAQQLRGDISKLLERWKEIIFYAKKLDGCIEYFTKDNMEEICPLLEDARSYLDVIAGINTDIQRKLEDIEIPDEIHLYGMGELREKGIERVKRESTVQLGG